MKRWCGIFLLVVVYTARGQVNTPILERRVSVKSNDEQIFTVLSRIALEGGFSFSYNSSLIHDDNRISLNASNKPVREILQELFHGTIDYKERGNHLILVKAPVRPVSAAAILIAGYVEDGVTRGRLANVSVYDKKLLTSAVTDDYGFFRIKSDFQNKLISLSASKRNYRDTITTLRATGTQYITITMMPLNTDSLVAPKEILSDSVRGEVFMPYETEPNVFNIHDTLYQEIQISLLPFIGSNGRLSGNTINNYSINMLGGYSLGTRQIELGFFFNLDRGNVSWLQVAGLGNLVGRNVYGIQAAGFFNVNGGETKAAQLSGFANVNLQDFQGIQLAGFSNVNQYSADGVLVAGFANIARGPSKGVQVAGAGNIQTARYQGSQFAGISNIASDHLSGSQVAAVFNYGRVVHGTQIGLINYSDSLGGVPVGLISYVRSGYHKLEVSSDEVFYTNLAFRTGVHRFYNILLAGIKPESVPSENVWTFGYGIGTAPRLTPWLDLNLDATAQHVSQGGFTNELSLLSKVHVGLDFRLAHKFSLYGGLTLNGYLSQAGVAGYPDLFNEHQPSIIHEQTFSNGNNLKMWWGIKLGLRFL